VVLVDAPCSGSGTWRRNPDLKWRFTMQALSELADLQQRILRRAARLVKPGGKLAYATCSLLACENEKQVQNFLVDNVTFRVVPMENLWDNFPQQTAPYKNSMLRLSPYKNGTDGFFAAVLEKAV
jgi:16S rRNA (cytosine967-C5)-methyltransferase